MQNADGIRRGLPRRAGMPFDEIDAPAARCQPLGARGAGEAGADHGGVATRRRFVLRASPDARKHADQHLALGSEARPLLEAKSRVRERASHVSRHRVGRERGTVRSKPRELAEKRACPHFRILRRREAVEEKRICRCVQSREHRRSVAEKQRERNATVVDVQAMEAGHRRRINAGELAEQRRELGPPGAGASEIVTRERMLLDGDVMQARTRGCARLPCLPRREKVEPGTEPGLDDREAFRVRPARRQPVSEQVRMPGFGEPARRGKIDIAEALGDRDTVLAQPKYGRVDGSRLRISESHAAHAP